MQQDASKTTGAALPSPVKITLRNNERLLVLFESMTMPAGRDRGDSAYYVGTLDGCPIVKLHDELPPGLTMLDLHPPFICLTRAAG